MLTEIKRSENSLSNLSLMVKFLKTYKMEVYCGFVNLELEESSFKTKWKKYELMSFNILIR